MAVHVLAVLAYKDGDRVTSEFLAHSVNTNPVVIRRLLLALQQARLVETRKGAGFGSRLSRSAARIDLGEVFRAVEQDEAFGLPRNKPNQACPVGHCIQTALEQVFGSALQALVQDLEQTTLADVLHTVRECCAKGSQAVR
jgi:Rrf2 family protein